MINRMLRVGVITQPHGLAGEVKIFPTTDEPEKFTSLENVYIQVKGGEIPLVLELPGGQRLTWRGWVRRLALRCAHPGAPVSLEAAVCVSGDMEVSA